MLNINHSLRKIDVSKLKPGRSRTSDEPQLNPEGGGSGKEPPENASTALPPEEPDGDPNERPTRPDKRKPLERFSLRGKADELEARAIAATPLLDQFALKGQMTMIYAPPNTGKTLIVFKYILDAIERGLIHPNQVIYVNGDDNSSGLAVKLRLLDDAGAHTLAPGQEGFRTADLATDLLADIEAGTARGKCVTIDTLKKFTDLMDKKRCSEFNQVLRQYAMAGGTIVALGHTTKNPNADGTPRYQGTSDVLDDFDAVYVAQPLVSKANPQQRLAKFVRLKSRGNNPDILGYVYTSDSDVSYAEKLTSVRSVDPAELETFVLENDDVGHPFLMEAFARRISEGFTGGKMALSKEVAKECRVSQRSALKVLEQYTGDTPLVHLWNVQTGGHGVQIYYLIDQARGGT